MNSLSPEDQLLVVSQGFQLLQGRLSTLVEVKAKEKMKILFDLLLGSSYPEDLQIEAAAKKLDMPVEDLRKLCDRLFN